jgi:hypothetical protein
MFRYVRTIVADSGFFLSRIRIFSSRIQGPGSKRFRIPDPELKKYDVYPGSGFRIQILIFYPCRIPDIVRVKKAPDPGSGSATLLRTLEH